MYTLSYRDRAPNGPKVLTNQPWIVLRLPIAILLLSYLLTGCTSSSHSDTSGPSEPTKTVTIGDEGIFRGNLQRTGEYASGTTPHLNSVLWTYASPDTIWSPLTVADGTVYSYSADGYLRGLDSQTGAVKWQVRSANAVPAVVDATLFYSYGYNLHAVDSRSKQEKWQFRTGGSIESSPAADNAVVYFGSDDGYLYAVDIATGQLKWKFKAGDPGILPYDPAVAGNTVYFIGSRNVTPPGSDAVRTKETVYAVDRETGREIWTFPTEGNVASLVLGNNSVFFICDIPAEIGSDFAEYIYGLDASSGQQTWRYQPELELAARLTWADGVLYTGTKYGSVDAIDTVTGQRTWRFLASGTVNTSLAGGVLYVSSSDHNIYAVDPRTGQKTSALELGSGLSYPPVIDSGMVFVSGGNYVYALR